ncbi:A/G-specific adenine glycosylase [Candidatus Peregrinibacteria bacterium]|nr:A/G-specific adenine glycosylase [Candidatus Peregrinibacteria bacterium]
MNHLFFFEKTIQNFYKKEGRKILPWRKKDISAYKVWVSEIMLQQTQVGRVIAYYVRFLKRFPDIFSLAKASWEEFLPYYAGLGYYRRGQNMLKTARVIVSEYEGMFPDNKEKLMKLPGVGEYTACAILSFAYGKNVVAFDTNLKRVFGRFLFGSKYAELDKNDIARSLNSDKKMLNAAIMDFANSICLNRPRCNICPLSEKCLYFKEKGEREYVLKKEKKHFPTKDARVFLWLHREHREYYSANPDRFEVFILDKKMNSRDGIKRYFSEHYGLELAVRPPHRKTFVDEIPTLFVNAQILLGDHEFAIFAKEDIEECAAKTL